MHKSSQVLRNWGGAVCRGGSQQDVSKATATAAVQVSQSRCPNSDDLLSCSSESHMSKVKVLEGLVPPRVRESVPGLSVGLLAQVLLGCGGLRVTCPLRVSVFAIQLFSFIRTLRCLGLGPVLIASS